MTSPFDQGRYHVRVEWGAAGLAVLAPADVVVIVDVLQFPTAVMETSTGDEHELLREDAYAASVRGAVVAATGASGAVVILGSLRNASAVADAVRAEQIRRGERTSVAVIAAGAPSAGHGNGSVRFAVEDHLAVGAIVDALAARGIDDASPEAAVAGEAYRGLRGAVRHLLTASGSGRELIAHGLRVEVLNAAQIDASTVVPVLRDGVFTAAE